MTHPLYEKLSPDQKQVYDLAVQGQNIEQIASRLGKPTGIVRAQVTRIINRGFTGFNVAGYNYDSGDAIDAAVGTVEMSGDNTVETYAPAAEPVQRSETRPNSGLSSNETIVQEALNAGQPQYNIEEVIKRIQAQGGLKDDVLDIHPMILMGMTMQFCRLAGGRMHAHQLIEDIYGAVRMLTGDSRADAAMGTKPWPPSESKNVQSVLDSLNAFKDELQKFQTGR